MISRRQFMQGSVAALAATPLLADAFVHQLAAYEQRYDQQRKAARLTQRAEPVLDFSSFQPHGDGVRKDTAALQAAVDAAAAKGGARILIPAGTYLIGAVQLKTAVTLELAAGATLLGSVDIADYYIPGADGSLSLQALLYAEHAKAIRLCGSGTIDGRGRELSLNINDLHHSGARVEPDFNYWRNRSNRRPSVIAFHHCQQLEIVDITVKNGASWVQHYAGCDDLRIENIKVHSDCYWNNDGIDINDCKKVRVRGCFINSADDAICLKSTTGPGHFNDDIEISDCVLRSSANGVKFGTESQGGFRHVRIRNITVFDTYRAAIALETVDGAFLEDVEVDGVTANNVGCGLFIRLGQRNMQVAADTPPGRLQQVRIRNLRAEIAFGRADQGYEMRGPGLNAFYNPIPASISGLSDACASDIVLENIDMVYPGRANRGQAYRPYHQLFLVPQERAAYPEYSMFGELPAYGLFVRHVRGLVLKNVRLSSLEADFRPALVLDDVIGLTLDQVHLGGAQRPQLVMQKVKVTASKGLSGQDNAGNPLALGSSDIAIVSTDRPYLEISSSPGANASVAFKSKAEAKTAAPDKATATAVKGQP
ncbi:glycoside hydrolase family 28 protein [Rheinheimera sp.]|uniref:glycoside hydrolase family 28 protein n=1 Tax=Rheinheimera sp. TaxID=1869214 RepID=UPI003D2B59C3